MERDFMGLNSKESVIKEEAFDGLKDSAPAKAPGEHWPFANKVSTLPHFMRHMSAHQDSAIKTTAGPVASSGFAQNLAGFLAKPHHAPSAASIAGLVDPWNKSVGSTAHMTIFYNGTVNVYNSITPEKAQAIMFLAGNGSCLFTSAGAQVRPPASKVDATDVMPVNQVNAQPSSAISSPVSVSSYNGAQSVSGSTSTDELVNNKPSAALPFSSDCKMDPPKPMQMPGLGSAAATTMIPRGIPQSRKVSLARFLEKRKERAMNAVPYNGAKKPECAT